MLKGKIGGMIGTSGQILSEGNVYNFNLNVVNGPISNGAEVDFQLDGSKVISVCKSGAIKQPTPVKPIEPSVKVEPKPEPKTEPTPVKVEPKSEPKPNMSKKLLDTDNRDLLTEEK